MTDMGLPNWVAVLRSHRSAVILVSMVTTFAGVALLIDRPKGTILEWLSVPLIVFGGGLFTWSLWPASTTGATTSKSLANRFLRRMTFDGRLETFFPAIGVGVIIADIAYNWAFSATPTLQTEDTIVLLGAASLLGYGFVPDRFARGRDFVLLFFLWLNAILVVPLLIARLYYADFDKSVDVYSWVALAPETSAMLTLLGVSNQVHAVVGSTAPGLTFTPIRFPGPVTVVITTACSGIYSFGIFASAFVAFVLTEYQKLSRRIWFLLALGLFAAYVANVLRMVVVVLVGYYTDTAQTDLQNLLIAHSYAGWLIFLGWISLFWGIVLRFVPSERAVRGGDETDIDWRRPEARCGICETVLSPRIPGVRCDCGRYYHRTCFAGEGGCPSCGRRSPSAGGPITTAEP